MSKLKPLYFYWISSLIIAISGYYLLSLVMSKHYIFGSMFRMLPYHHRHPIQYILITCLFFGLFAVLFQNKFTKSRWSVQLLITLLVVFMTITASAPFGGMLWHLHDMFAGRFPDEWLIVLFGQGSIEGLMLGWPIILDSFPYNILGVISSFFLLKKGAEISQKLN